MIAKNINQWSQNVTENNYTPCCPFVGCGSVYIEIDPEVHVTVLDYFGYAECRVSGICLANGERVFYKDGLYLAQRLSAQAGSRLWEIN